MIYLWRFWDWCAKHWKLLLAFLGGIIVFVLGYTRGNKGSQRNKLKAELAKKELGAVKDAKGQREKAVQEIIKDRNSELANLTQSQKNSEEQIDKKKVAFEKNLTKDDINKFLKEKGIDRE